LTIRMRGVNIVNNSFTSTKTIQLVGIPDACIVSESYVGNVVMNNANTQFGAYLADFYNFLSAPANNWGYLGLASPLSTLTANAFTLLQPSNVWQVNVPNHGCSSGDLIKINGCDNGKFNRTWRVIVPVAGGGGLDPNNLNLVRSQYLSSALQPQGARRVTRIQTASGTRLLQFYQFSGPVGFVTPSKHNPGRHPQFVSFKKKARH
jgi:hypothetical protein